MNTGTHELFEKNSASVVMGHNCEKEAEKAFESLLTISTSQIPCPRNSCLQSLLNLQNGCSVLLLGFDTDNGM